MPNDKILKEMIQLDEVGRRRLDLHTAKVVQAHISHSFSLNIAPYGRRSMGRHRRAHRWRRHLMRDRSALGLKVQTQPAQRTPLRLHMAQASAENYNRRPSSDLDSMFFKAQAPDNIGS